MIDILKTKWVVGKSDRGIRRFDYAVLVQGGDKSIAEHIVELRNKTILKNKREKKND